MNKIYIALFSALIGTGASAASESTASEAGSALASISNSIPALTQALSKGAEKACVPTHLTISGNVGKGSRLYVSSLIGQFPEQLRLAAKGDAKISKAQGAEIQRLLGYAKEAQSTAMGMPDEAVNKFKSATGFEAQIGLVCMSREFFSTSK